MVEMRVGPRSYKPGPQQPLIVASKQQNVTCVHLTEELVFTDAIKLPEIHLIS